MAWLWKASRNKLASTLSVAMSIGLALLGASGIILNVGDWGWLIGTALGAPLYLDAARVSGRQCRFDGAARRAGYALSVKLASDLAGVRSRGLFFHKRPYGCPVVIGEGALFRFQQRGHFFPRDLRRL